LRRGWSLVIEKANKEDRVEQWKPIEGWAGYEVSDQGRVRSFKKCRARPDEPLPRILAGYYLPTGYHMMELKDRKLRRKIYTHRLVLEAFVGPVPKGMEVAHNNGDPRDNRLENLRYATPMGNAQDKRKHGSHKAGGSHYMSKLTDEQARDVFRFPGTCREAADAFGVSYHLAYRIRTRRTYKNATRGL